MKNAIIFDLDGTLLNTLGDLTDSVNYALSAFNMPSRTIDEIRTFVGNGIRLLVERAVPKNTEKDMVDKVFDCFKGYYPTHCMIKTAPYDGVIALLKTLKEKGIKTAIVSNKYQQGVDDLAQNMFMGLVDVAIGERAGMKTKPNPEPVNLALSLSGIKKENAYYVGDSDVDVMTAKNSGLDMIAVTWGFKDKEFLQECGATTFIDKPEQLLDFLSK